jgi:hypothetical protein
MYPILKVSPIILPKERFTDKYGEPNAFVDMNPSMHISKEGDVTLLVRRVNYRKYADGRFTLGRYPSESKYVVAKGAIADLSRLEVNPMRIEYGIPTYSALWKGPEDIRFVNEHDVIATIPECNPNGNPSIFKARFGDDYTLKNVENCFPNGTEKNWMPYEDAESMVIYSVSPFRIKHLKADDIETLPIHIPGLEGYHGSTNGVAYMDDTRIFLIHVNRERTYHRWLLFDPSKKTAKASREFTFFQHSYIEFPVSLCKYGKSLYVSMGVNDEAAFVLEVAPPIFY